MNKELAIILINWNQYELTNSCIKSILNCSYKKFKIILVDNCSKDNSVTKLKRDFPNVHFIQNNSNLGFTGANNIGIEYAKSEDYEYIMLLNNDTVVKNTFIEPLVDSFKKNVMAVQPLILNYPDSNTIWNNGGSINSLFGIFKTINKNKNISLIKNFDKKETEWISGCCFMIRSSVIDEIGILDDNFFVYYEDVDWSIRITEKKYKILIVPSSIIYHFEGGSWKTKKKNKEGYISPYTHYLNIRNHIYLIKKHKNMFIIPSSVFFQIFKIISYSLYFLLRLRFSKLKMVWKGLWDSFKM